MYRGAEIKFTFCTLFCHFSLLLDTYISTSIGRNIDLAIPVEAKIRFKLYPKNLLSVNHFSNRAMDRVISFLILLSLRIGFKIHPCNTDKDKFLTLNVFSQCSHLNVSSALWLKLWLHLALLVLNLAPHSPHGYIGSFG